MEKEIKVYIYFIYVYLVISLINIVVNIFNGYPLKINIKWAILSVVLVIIYGCIKHGKDVEKCMFLVFLSTILIILPISFFEYGTIDNTFIIYMAGINVAICFFIEGKSKYFLILATILVPLILVCLKLFVFKDMQTQAYIPSESANEIDAFVQMSINIVGVVIISMLFTNERNRRQKEASEYARSLEKINSQLEWYAGHDDLTKAYNRNSLFKYLENKKQIENSYFMIIDVDDFKGINDNYGHLEGDRVLKEFANALGVDDKCKVCRYGGDEFVVLLEGVNSDYVRNYISIIKEKVTHITIGNKSLSVSGGVAHIDNGNLNDTIISKADGLLYQVKCKGKNDILFLDK